MRISFCWPLSRSIALRYRVCVSAYGLRYKDIGLFGRLAANINLVVRES